MTNGYDGIGFYFAFLLLKWPDHKTFHSCGFNKRRFYFKTSKAVAFYPSVWWVTLGQPFKSLMFSVTTICTKQPLHDCFKDICGGYNLLRVRKAFSEKTTHSCLRSFLLGNRSEKAPLILTQPAMPGYSYLKMTRNFSGQSKLWRDCQRPGLLTLIKVWFRYLK